MTIGQSQDDGLEKRVAGAGNFTAASDIDRGPIVKKCVARVWHDSGPGTGLLLPDNWFLTNHHVLPTIEKAKEAVAQFNYERQADGMFAQMKQFPFNPDAGFYTSPVNDGDDWTVVKLKGDANAEFGAVHLEEIAPGMNESVSIIQHPDAGPRQVAEGPVVEVIEAAARRIRYKANTLPGSSGSPVFNRRWQVVGLHHSSATSRNKETGESFECNEGIHIAALLEGLKKVGVWPHQPGTGDLRAQDGTWIIERDVDREAIKHLKKLRITVALKGGSQMGKSLIADRIGREMQIDGWESVTIDLRHEFAAEDYQTGHQFLTRLAQKIIAETHGDDAILKSFERDGTPTAFKTFLEELKLGRSTLRMLLTLDGVESLSGTPCCSSVLSALRIVHNDLRSMRNDAWLQMVFIYAITPRQTGAMGSVFDVAKIVEVSDFSEGELQKLAALYGLPDVDVAKLYSFLGGHPTLTQDTLLAMQEDDIGLDELIDDAKTGGIYKHRLERLKTAFNEHQDGKHLAAAFRGLVQGKPLENEETFDALLALGVVKGTYSGDAAVRCELYKAWLPPRIPK